jgi:hypothetical protein
MTQRTLPSSEQPHVTLGVAPSLAADPSPGLVNASQAFTPLPTNKRGSLKFDRSLNFVGGKKRLETNNYN